MDTLKRYGEGPFRATSGDPSSTRVRKWVSSATMLGGLPLGEEETSP